MQNFDELKLAIRSLYVPQLMSRLWLSSRMPILFLLGAMIPATAAEDAPVFAGKEGEVVTVTASYIDIHTGPGRGYPVFHAVAKHEALRLLKSRTDWYKVVTIDGETGWVPRAKLKDALTTDGATLEVSASDLRDPQK
jgi:uncharacterized protein YgiM (DUF1202 family)